MKLKLKKKINRKYVWSVYSEWFGEKFDEKPVDVNRFYRFVQREDRLSTVLLILYQVFEKDCREFLEYMEFIYDNWMSKDDGAKSYTDIAGWIGSEKMLERFSNRIKTRKNKTYSNHDYLPKTASDKVFVAGFCVGE